MFIQNIISLRNFISQNDFQVSFLSSLLSGITLSALVGLITYQFTNIFKRPKLSIVVKQGPFYRDEVIFTKRDDGDYEASFYLSIKNQGTQTVMPQEGYWHIYFPNALDVKPLEGPNLFSAQLEKSHLRDIINMPIFPSSFLDFGPEYKVHIPKDNKDWDIRYFFETNYGYFPKSVKLNQKDGSVQYKDMGKINVIFQEQ